MLLIYNYDMMLGILHIACNSHQLFRDIDKFLNYDINCTLFLEVQTFIVNTNRFSMATV